MTSIFSTLSFVCKDWWKTDQYEMWHHLLEMWHHLLAASLVWKRAANTFSLEPSGPGCRQKKSHEMINSILVITSITTTIILIYQDDGCQSYVQRLLGPTFAVLSAFTLRLPDLDNFQVQFQIPVFVFVFVFVFVLGYLKYLHLFHPCCSNNPSDPPLMSPPTQRSCYKRHFSKIFSHSSI